MNPLSPYNREDHTISDLYSSNQGQITVAAIPKEFQFKSIKSLKENQIYPPLKKEGINTMPMARPMAVPMSGPLNISLPQLLPPTTSQNISHPNLLVTNQSNSEFPLQSIMQKEIQMIKEGSIKLDLNRLSSSANKENIISSSPENKAIPNIQNQIIKECLENRKEVPFSNNFQNGQHPRNAHYIQVTKERKDLQMPYDMLTDFPITTKTIPELKSKDLKDLYEIQELHETKSIINVESSKNMKSKLEISKPEIKSKDFDKLSERDPSTNNNHRKQNIQSSDLNVLIKECSFHPQIHRVPDRQCNELTKSQKGNQDLNLNSNLNLNLKIHKEKASQKETENHQIDIERKNNIQKIPIGEACSRKQRSPRSDKEKEKGKEKEEINKILNDQELRIKPLINEKSRRIVMNKQKQNEVIIPVYEKLYSGKSKNFHKIQTSQSPKPQNSNSNSNFNPLATESQNTIEPKSNENEKPFIPQISERSKMILRIDNIDNILYNDAVRRMQKNENNNLEINNDELKKLVNSKQNVIYLEKHFNKHFKKVTKKYFGKNGKLERDEVKVILQNLGLINDSQEDENYLQDIWNILGGNENNFIIDEHLKYLLKIVLKIDLSNSLLKCSSPSVNTSNSKFNLNISKEEIKKMQIHFSGLNINKNVYFIKGQNDCLQHNDSQAPGNKPCILKNSSELANKARNKLIEQSQSDDSCFPLYHESQKSQKSQNSLMDMHELMKLHQKAKESKIMKQKEEIDRKICDECTFSPRINEASNIINNLNNKNQLSSRYLEKKKMIRIERTADDYDYEKNKEKCTFKPQINSSKASPNRMKECEMPKNFEKVIERLKKGKEEKQKIIHSNERLEGTTCLKLDITSNKFINIFNKSNKKNNTGKINSPVMKSKQDLKTYNQPKKLYSKLIKNKDKYHNGNLNITSNFRESKTFDEGGKENQKRLLEFQKQLLHNILLKEKVPALILTKTSCIPQKNKNPILFLEVNMGENKSERIVIYEGDSAETVAQNFSQKHNFDEVKKGKLLKAIKSHITKLLTSIEEERQSVE